MDQIDEWEAYYMLHPSESLKQDFRMAMLSSMINNIATKVHGKAGAKLSEFTDFLINWDYLDKQDTPRQSVEEMKNIMLSFADSQNKAVKRKELGIHRKPRSKK